MAWLPKRNVIVPYDFSDEAQGAVRTALDMVEEPAHVHVAYVLQDLSPLEMGELWSHVNDGIRREHALKAIAEKLGAPEFKGISTIVLSGDPGAAIAQYASESKADLIVVPSHGRSGLARLVLGSVAEKVVRRAHCPVLVLRW